MDRSWLHQLFFLCHFGHKWNFIKNHSNFTGFFSTCKFYNLNSYTPLSKCFQKSLRDSHTKLLLLDTPLLHGHWGSPLCPTAPLGASLASIYTGHLSHIVNLPGLVSPLCLLSLLPLNLWSQQIPPLLPQGAIPDNCAQGLKVAWWSVVMYPLGQYSLWEFLQTWCFCVPVTELFLSFFPFFLFLPCSPLPPFSNLQTPGSL